MTNNNDDIARDYLEKARATNDRFQKFDLLKLASEYAEAVSLKGDIQKEIDTLIAQIRPNVDLQLSYLEKEKRITESDPLGKRFTAALRILEDIKEDYPFSPIDIKKIEDARSWFDDKTRRDGMRTSRQQLGGLQDKYMFFDLFLNTPDTFFARDLAGKDIVSRDEHLADLKKNWQEESRKTREKIIQNAEVAARESPSAARAILRNTLTAEVEYKLDELKGEEKYIKINEFPFVDADKEIINSYINKLAKLCEQEAQAEKLRGEALEAATSSPYEGYEKLVKARMPSWDDVNWFVLPGLDQAIRNSYDEAVKFRARQISLVVGAAESELDQLANLGKEALEKQLKNLEERLKLISVDVNKPWPGDGKSLDLLVEGMKVKFEIHSPPQIEDLKNQVETLEHRFNRIKSTYEHLIKEDESIRKLLVSSDADQRQAGLQSFQFLEQNPEISQSLIFKTLEGFKVQQTSFEDGEQGILKHYTNENWPVVLDLCREFEAKPGYAKKCPREIKEKVSFWKNEAGYKLRLQKLQGLVEKEDYLGAKYVLDRLLNDKLDIKPVDLYVAKIEKAEKEGEAVWSFYRNTLVSADLNNHVILDILKDPEGIFDRMDALGPTEAKVVRAILGKGKGDVSFEDYKENIQKYLSHYLRNTPFEKKVELLEKVRHVVGTSSKQMKRGWPTGSSSFALYEARLLMRHLEVLVRDDALSAIRRTADGGHSLDAVAPMITAIYEFGFGLAEEDRQALKAIEFSRSKMLAEADGTSPEAALKTWETVKEHFPGDIDILVAYREAKQNWYVSQIEKLKENKDFRGALRVISQGFEDEDVGTIWQLYREKSLVHLSLEEFEESKDALNTVIRKNARTNEVKKIEVEIELGERRALYFEKPLVYAASLLEFWKILDRKYKNLAAQELQKIYQFNSTEYVQTLKELMKNDREKAWLPLLDLIKLEDLYAQVNTEAVRISDGFVEQLIPTLYSMGVDLINKSENFKQRTLNHRTGLRSSILEGEQIHDRLVSYEALLSKYSGGESSQPLDDVLRTMINKTVRGQQKKDFLNELDRQVNKEIRDRIYKFDEIRLYRNRMRQDIDTRLRGCEKKYGDATDASVWFSCALSVMLGGINSENAWKPLEDLSAPLREYNNFLEVIDHFSDLDLWKITLLEIHNKIDVLRDMYREEKFDLAEQSVQEIDALFIGLENSSSESAKKQKVVGQLRENIIVRNSFTEDDVSGLDSIRLSIEGLKMEIRSWVREVTKKTAEVNETKEKVLNLQNRILRFKRDCYEKHKMYLITSDAKKCLDEYLNTAGLFKVPMLNSNITTKEEWDSPNIDPPMTKKIPTSEPVNSTNRSFFDIFRKKLETKNPLLEGIESSANFNDSLFEQKKQIDEINTFNDGDPVAIPVRTEAASGQANALKVLIGINKSMAEYLDSLSSKNQICQDKVSYPTSEELRVYNSRSQYSNTARRIVEADLIGADQIRRDEVEAFRDVLRRAKWA